MDQNKNQGQQNPDQYRQPENPNREPSEGTRTQQMPGGAQSGETWTQGGNQSGNQGGNQNNRGNQSTTQERGTGSQGEQNRGDSNRSVGGGIPDRGMDRDLDEQEDLLDRDSDQSER
jgi:hypothetical protein